MFLLWKGVEFCQVFCCISWDDFGLFSFILLRWHITLSFVCWPVLKFQEWIPLVMVYNPFNVLLLFARILFRIFMLIFVKDICDILVVYLPGFGISVKVFKIHSWFKKRKERAWIIVFTKVLWLCTHLMGTCIGEGNGNPLQCSCLENPRDSGAWWAAVYGVAQSRTRLKRLSSSSSNGNMQEYEHFTGICTGKLFGRYCFCPTSLFCRDRIKIQWVKWFTQSKISYSEPRLRILLLDFQLALILLNYGLQFAYT